MARMSNEGSGGSYSGDPEVDAVTARVRMAINESNARASKPRSKASDTSKMNPLYKPKASPGPAMNTLNVYGTSKPQSLNLYGASNTKAKTKPVSANEREGRVSSKSISKPATKTKDTSFNKGGLIPALTSGDAEKFKNTFKKKGLLPALRGK